jgi:phospholipid N-methyltransferase
MNDFYGIQTRANKGDAGVSRGGKRFLDKLDPAVAERLEFLGAFLRKPGRVGAVMPSSPFLAQAMLRGCDLERAEAVIELGPGTGAFTGLIRQRIGAKTTFFALEVDPESVRGLRRRFPDVNVHHDSAERATKYLRQYRKKKADYVISGLPWANMPVKVQESILDAILKVMEPDGLFTTFAYVHACWLPRARRFRERLENHFGEVKTSRIVWRNVPPAFVYRCRINAAG